MTLSVTLAGADITARLTAAVVVDAVAGTARLADLAYLPATPSTPGRVQGQTLVIADGAVTLFTGRVERAERDPRTGIITVRGTDRLQEHCAGLSEAAILAAVPGYYSADLHGVRASGWEQMQDVVSTTLGDYDLTPAGVGRYTAWATSGTPAVTYTTYVDGTLEEHRPDLSALINHVAIVLEARWARRWHREHECTWSADGEWCDWLQDAYSLPERSEIEQAASGGTWRIKTRADGISTASEQTGIATTGHPESASNPCGLGIGWTLTEAGRATCWTAAWTVATRYAQWIRERFELTVAVADADPQTSAEASWSIDQDTGADGWDESAETGVPSGAVAAGTGGWRWDQRDDADIETGLHVAIRTAARDIVGAHREWELSFTEPADPARDLGQWVRLNCSDGDWSGQVSRVVHTYDLIAGRAVTALTIALGGGALPTYTLPTAPTTTGGYSSISDSTSFPTHIGNDDAADEEDPDWTGWVGNYQEAQGSPDPEQIYEERFVVEYPEVPEDHREERAFSADPLTVAVTVILPD